MNLGQLVPDGDDALPRRLRDLERELMQMRAARSLEASSIGAGGLTIMDGGSIAIKDGGGVNIADGGNIAIKDGGTLTVDDSAGHTMPLSQLAFGLRGASTEAQTTGTKNSWRYGAPSVSFRTETGYAIVIVSCQMVVGYSGTGTPCQGAMSYRLTGPSNVAADRKRGLYAVWNGSGMNTTFQSSFLFVHTNLARGNYTVSSAYVSYTTASNLTAFSNRSIAVLPF